MPNFDEQYHGKIFPIYILIKKKILMNLYFYYAFIVGYGWLNVTFQYCQWVLDILHYFFNIK